MYDGDSFYTLTGIGRTGLVILSVTMALALLWLAMKLTRRLILPLRIVVAALLFFAFVWLSPQVYYTYYMTLFDGLPWQVVVKDPPNWRRLFGLMTFDGEANLSAHSQGGLGWLLLGVAAFSGKGCFGKSIMR